MFFSKLNDFGGDLPNCRLCLAGLVSTLGLDEDGWSNLPQGAYPPAGLRIYFHSDSMLLMGLGTRSTMQTARETDIIDSTI